MQAALVIERARHVHLRVIQQRRETNDASAGRCVQFCITQLVNASFPSRTQSAGGGARRCTSRARRRVGVRVKTGSYHKFPLGKAGLCRGDKDKTNGDKRESQPSRLALGAEAILLSSRWHWTTSTSAMLVQRCPLLSRISLKLFGCLALR